MDDVTKSGFVSRCSCNRNAKHKDANKSKHNAKYKKKRARKQANSANAAAGGYNGTPGGGRAP